jgi:transcriptional regulator with XRE-family HTH domain
MDKLTTPEAIGKRVATLRMEKGFSRRTFAHKVKIPETSYRDRELGRFDFTIPQLRRMSPVLGESVSYLLTGRPDARLETLAA